MLTLLDPPESPLLTLAEVKEALKIDSADEDNYTYTLIDAVTQYLDGRDGILGRCLRPQRWRLDLPEFPFWRTPIVLPLPPTINVEYIDYFDDAGVRVVMSSDTYRVIDGGVSGHKITPVRGGRWPLVANFEPDPDNVSITFRAGYQDLASPANESVPQPIRLAAMLLIGDMFENRADTIAGVTVAQLPNAARALLQSYRLMVRR